MTTELKRIVIYVSDKELDRLKDRAAEHNQSLSAYLRGRLGLKAVYRRGAPDGNRNAQGRRVPLHSSQSSPELPVTDIPFPDD